MNLNGEGAGGAGKNGLPGSGSVVCQGPCVSEFKANKIYIKQALIFTLFTLPRLSPGIL
jgi:hypothetical protein